MWICILNIDDPFAILVLVLVFEPQVLSNNTESEAQASHQMSRRSILIVNELGYEVRL